MSHPLTYVLFHSPCIDGYGAAFAAWKYFGADATYVPLSYGTKPPELREGTDVFMVDISFKRPVMLEFAKHHKRVVVIDHHVTAKEELANITAIAPNVEVHFDMEHSGAVLTWDYFFRSTGQPTPQLLLHVEDRDLWRFALPDTRAINAALNTHPQDFATWRRLCMNLDQLILEGAVLLRLEQQQLEVMLNEARSAQFELPDKSISIVPAVNAPYWISSELGHALLKKYPTAPFAACYRDTASGRRDWSLRSEDSRVDVSSVAKLYGGGGHRNAAGCSEAAPFGSFGGFHLARIPFAAGPYEA